MEEINPNRDSRSGRRVLLSALSIGYSGKGRERKTIDKPEELLQKRVRYLYICFLRTDHVCTMERGQINK